MGYPIRIRKFESFQENVVLLNHFIVGYAVFVAPAHALDDVLALHRFQFFCVILVQYEVNGCVDGFHLLLSNDGIALLNLVQKIRIMIHRKNGGHCRVLRKILQLFEHCAQVRQQRIRRFRPEMFAHNVSLRIGMAAGARF